MTQIINAIYEEGVLKPLEPLNIQEHAEVRVTIESKMPESLRLYGNIITEIRKRQLTRGYKSPTREDVDSYLQAERDNWEK
jgi:predicted DNA-binding antitoxin AbrB/MazE fold protein